MTACSGMIPCHKGGRSRGVSTRCLGDATFQELLLGRDPKPDEIMGRSSPEQREPELGGLKAGGEGAVARPAVRLSLRDVGQKPGSKGGPGSRAVLLRQHSVGDGSGIPDSQPPCAGCSEGWSRTR